MATKREPVSINTSYFRFIQEGGEDKHGKATKRGKDLSSSDQTGGEENTEGV